MRLPSIRPVACLVLAAATSSLHAADVEAGRAKAQAVCAACHGANGVSVGDTIPNLAGQRAAYLERQLRAWKDGSRKNAIMNAIGSQLGADDIGNVAAYFASLPAAAPGARSDLMPALARVRLTLPADFRSTYTPYHTIDQPEAGRVTRYWASPVAVRAAKAGQPLPDGAAVIVEVSTARLGADKKPLTGADGHLVADQPVSYSAMAREAGWGQDVPEMLRNENWQYAVFTATGQARDTVNQAECLACHKPQDKSSFVFTLERLSAVAKGS